MSPITRTLVIVIAIVGFLFDTYELLMLPLVGASALADLLNVPAGDPVVGQWIGRISWMSAVCGGVFGLLGGWMIDRYGRKRIMMISIIMYSFSPLAAAFSTELWQFVLFRCTTFIGVCVEMVAAVTWLAELFDEKRSRERIIAWCLAAASLGGLLVSTVYQIINEFAAKLPGIPTAEGASAHAAWRYTLLTGLIPGAIILALMPRVPESAVWLERKLAGKLKRPSFALLFSPKLLRTTIVTTVLSACAYAAAFGALQLTPSRIMPARPEVGPLLAETAKKRAEVANLKKATPSPENAKEIAALGAEIATRTKTVESYRGDIQFWQELGGLAGRIVLALLVTVMPPRMLLQYLVIPAAILLPLTYLEIIKMDYAMFAGAIFLCGLFTVSQMSFLSELLPKVFPLFLRGTGGSFATNVGGRMIGTCAAFLNTEALTPFYGNNALATAKGAAIIGATVFLIAFVASFFLPHPDETPQ